MPKRALRHCCFVLIGLLTCPAVAAVYPLPNGANGLLGHNGARQLVYEDTFAKVAREEGIGYEALRRANPGVDDWLPGEGTHIVLPTARLLPQVAREGIVVNLSELRLYFFDDKNKQVYVYPIGIGSEGTETPVMQTHVVGKIEQPVWYPPPSIRAKHAANGKVLARQVPPGPDNPLGDFAIQLGRSGYFIHGTNQPIGVGRRISSGCIRLYARHIEALVYQVDKGTPVSVIRQPYKVAWQDGALYLEAHTPDERDNRDYTDAVEQIIRATEQRAVAIDWTLAVDTARAGLGLPVRISR